MKPPLKFVVQEFGYTGNMGDIVVCTNRLPLKHDLLYDNFLCFAEFAYQQDLKTEHFAFDNVINLIIVKNYAINPHYLDDFEIEKANIGTELACLFCLSVVASVVESPPDIPESKSVRFHTLDTLPSRASMKHNKHLSLPDQQSWGMKDLTRLCFDGRQLCEFNEVLAQSIPIPTQLFRAVR